MKNLKPYNKDAFEFHCDIVKSKKKRKNDTEYKARLIALEDELKELYELHIAKFLKNNLKSLVPKGYSGGQKKDLGELYKYSSRPIQELKQYLITTLNKRTDNTCPNCTLNEINTFDHFLPQSIFSEFIVNPLNLVPCCSICNGKKLNSWEQDQQSKFLNLYLDILPPEQFLFVDVTFEGDDSPQIIFTVENRNGIDSDIFSLIKSHYDKLELCSRFNDNIDTVVSELDLEINKYLKNLPLEIIVQTIQEQCDELKELLGNNFWKVVLKSSLIKNEEYLIRFG